MMHAILIRKKAFWAFFSVTINTNFETSSKKVYYKLLITRLIGPVYSMRLITDSLVNHDRKIEVFVLGI